METSNTNLNKKDTRGQLGRRLAVVKRIKCNLKSRSGRLFTLFGYCFGILILLHYFNKESFQSIMYWAGNMKTRGSIDNDRPSNVYKKYGDVPIYGYSACLSLKLLSNQRAQLTSPKDLAKYNCTHLMTYATGPVGRLGNVMFTIAGLIGIATWHGYTPVFTENWKSLRYFEFNNKINFTLSNIKEIVQWHPVAGHNQIFYHLNHSSNWTINGHFQSWKYFQGAEDRVRAAFTFKSEYRLNATKYLESISNKGVLNIGIHVRRGDFASEVLLKQGFSVVPVAYIEKAMNFFRHSLKHVQFIFVSNGMNWCKANFNGSGIFFSPFTDPGLDMALMSSCDHMIITSGTFGWWGAWLAGGITVHYANFPQPGSLLERNQFPNNHTDYYPPHWLSMV